MFSGRTRRTRYPQSSPNRRPRIMERLSSARLVPIWRENDVPSVIHARATAQEYQQCKLLRRPPLSCKSSVESAAITCGSCCLGQRPGRCAKIAYGIRALEPNYYMKAPEENFMIMRAKFYDRQGDDEQCRSLYSLNDLAENKTARYWIRFYFWDSVRGGKAAPTVAEFNIETVFGSAFSSSIHNTKTQKTSYL